MEQLNQSFSELNRLTRDFLSDQARANSLKIVLNKKEVFFQTPTILSSGQESSWYFDARVLNATPEGAYWTSLALIALIQKYFPQSKTVGGSGVDGRLALSPIVVLSDILYRQGLIPNTLPGFFVEDTGQIKGYCYPTGNLLIEGTTTTGNSILKTIGHLTDQGKHVEGVLAILDRGGSQAITKANFKFVSLFTPRDLGIKA